MYTESDLKSEYLENGRFAKEFWSSFKRDAQVYTLAAAGYTWSEAERKALAVDGREPIEFNIMRRPLEFFSGYLRDNVNQVVYSPVEGSDQKTADQFTKLSYYVWDKGKGYPRFLSACDESIKSGMSLCGIQMDYSKDFVNGDVAFFKRTYNSFLLDPTFEETDLSDCGFGITTDFMNKDILPSLLPYISKKDLEELAFSYKDELFPEYHPQISSFNRNRTQVVYNQYYRRTTRKRKFLVDIDSGFYSDITDKESKEIRTLKNGIARFNDIRKNPDLYNFDLEDIPNVEIRDVERPYVELTVFLNGIPVYTGDDKTGVTEMYPFAPLICYIEPSIWMSTKRIQGLASCNYSLQRQFNKRHMKIQDMMDSDISTGYAYLIGAVKDPNDLLQTGQNKLVGIDPDNAPEGLNSIRELKGGGANPALIEYQNVLDQLSLTLSNVNESVLGTDDKGNTQVSGRLAQVRIAQGLKGNRKIFDNIEESQQVIGSIVLKAIQENYPKAKVKRILGEPPTAQFDNRTFEVYDAVIKEGVRSKSQKDAYYYELVDLKRSEVVNVPESAIIDALDMSGASDLKEHIERQEQQQQEQQQKIDEQERVALELANSQAEANLAMSAERRARVVSDLALSTERISESEENRAQAALAKAKTITEIEAMNEDRIMKVLQFVEMLESQEVGDREAIGQKVMSQAKDIETSKLSTPSQSPKQQTSGVGSLGGVL